ncbi:MAG: DUF3341 domain-containing protein [Syntrophobacteraceae bacterium]
MAGKTAVVGVYEYLNELVMALHVLKSENIKVDTVYSPTPRHEIREALGTPELGAGRFFALTGAVLGICAGLFLVWYTSVQWRFIVGGKPPVPVAPAVIPAFEFLILFAVLFNLAGMLIKNRLPKFKVPAHFDGRFTQDRFGIVVRCPEEQRERVSSILRESGAEEVRQLEE